MNDLISRQAAINALGEFLKYISLRTSEQEKVLDTFKAIPSAEKTGKWIDEWRSGLDGTRYWYRACSECGYEREDDDAEKDTNYCPNCGARMVKNE